MKHSALISFRHQYGIFFNLGLFSKNVFDKLLNDVYQVLGQMQWTSDTKILEALPFSTRSCSHLIIQQSVLSTHSLTSILCQALCCTGYTVVDKTESSCSHGAQTLMANFEKVSTKKQTIMSCFYISKERQRGAPPRTCGEHQGATYKQTLTMHQERYTYKGLSEHKCQCACPF